MATMIGRQARRLGASLEDAQGLFGVLLVTIGAGLVTHSFGVAFIVLGIFLLLAEWARR